MPERDGSPTPLEWRLYWQFKAQQVPYRFADYAEPLWISRSHWGLIQNPHRAWAT